MKVIIQKADLDTCLTGLILGVGSWDEVIGVRGDASPADLDDPQVLCIEAGGSGRIEQNNFDHHETDAYFPPACRQAYEHGGRKDERMDRLVAYVSMVDENSKAHPPVPFPSLSNLFSGMLFVEKGAVSQFLAGMKLLLTAFDEGMDPFAAMPIRPEWQSYVAAKVENQKKLEEMLAHCEYFTSKTGLRIGFSEHDAIGGIGALYAQGCHVAVLYNPQFGEPPVPKFTIAGNNIHVGRLKGCFEKLEKGWGGTRTILGSPQETGTTLPKDEVLSIVRENL